MERYFFDVHDGGQLVRDQIGVPMASPDDAWRAAARILLDFVEDRPFPGEPGGSYMYVNIRTGRRAEGLVELSLSRSHTAAAG